MAILIKGMEMPNHDDEYVIFTVYGDGGVVYGKLNRHHVRYKNRAVPVPEPHGRLGDLTAAEKQIDYMANLDWNKKVGASGGMLAALEVVEDAQTIIPARRTDEE